MVTRQFYIARERWLALGACLLTLSWMTVSACAPAARTRTEPVAALAPRSTAQDLFERSPIRLRLRNLPAQAWRIAEPNWSRVPEHERGRVQAVFLGAFSEQKVSPLAERRMEAAAAQAGAHAQTALEWWKQGAAAEIRFAEATAARPDSSSKEFLESYAAVRDDEAPEIRMSRIRRLAAATGAVQTTLDLTHALGHAVARVINHVSSPRVDGNRLDATIREERRDARVVDSYESVVLAAMLQRYRRVDLEDLDAYIAFAETDAGRWYHRAAAEAVVEATREVGADVEKVLAQTEPTEPVFDAESLMISLPSGRRVRMLGVAGMRYETTPAVVFRYETSLPIGDLGAVRREAGEVWDRVRDDVEAMGTTAVVLQATGSVSGWVFTTASSRSFAWRKNGQGGWVSVRSGPGGDGSSLESLHSETLWSVPP